jgi:protein SCO1/2
MKFNIIFVSVDPESDKPADIGKYVSLFRTPIYGLTGTPADLARIQKGYGVYVRKVPLGNGDYTVDHTAAIYLMDARGKFVTTIDYHENDKVALEKLRRLIV